VLQNTKSLVVRKSHLVVYQFVCTYSTQPGWKAWPIFLNLNLYVWSKKSP